MFEIKKPCQNCKSYVLKPKKKVELNLKNIVKNIEELSIEVLAFTGSMLSIRKKCKINIYNSGKLVVITKDSYSLFPSLINRDKYSKSFP